MGNKTGRFSLLMEIGFLAVMVLVVLTLSLYQARTESMSIKVRAAGADMVTYRGEIQPLPVCLAGFLCYRIKNPATGEDFYLYSPRLIRPTGCKEEKNCDGVGRIDLAQFIGQRVELKGLLVKGRQMFIIPKSVIHLAP